jgi:hypothetical protein
MPPMTKYNEVIATLNAALGTFAAVTMTAMPASVQRHKRYPQ